MLPSRKITAAFAGVFLIGALAGGLLTSTWKDADFSSFLTKTSDPKGMASRISQKYVRDYQLSADEQARIAPLIEEMTQHLYLDRRQFGVDILATLDDYHAKIGAQMSPDHRQAYEKANQERKRRMSTMLLLDQPDAVQGQK
jgi:hypothetical protein